MKNILIISLLVVGCFFGCRPDPIRINIEQLPPQVVVLSQVIPNRVMTIVLTKTIGVLDVGAENANQDLINQLLEKDAKVSITYRNETHELLELQGGIYTSLDILQHPNEEYKLDVLTADGKQLRSTTKMLPKVELSSTIDSLLPSIVRSETDTIVYFNYKFKDLPEKNWYMMNFYKSRQESEPDISNFFSGNGSDNATTVLFDDLLAEDSFIKGTTELYNLSASDTLIVAVSNISESYYNYLQTRITSQGVVAELFKEPIPAPTNVEGGLGFFNTHYPVFRIYDLNDY